MPTTEVISGDGGRESSNLPLFLIVEDEENLRSTLVHELLNLQD